MYKEIIYFTVAQPVSQIDLRRKQSISLVPKKNVELAVLKSNLPQENVS